jgi:hypothetical protein
LTRFPLEEMSPARLYWRRENVSPLTVIVPWLIQTTLQ